MREHSVKKMMSGMSDTIAAIATFPSFSAVGLIKISGPGVFPLIKRIFKPYRKKDLKKVRPFSMHYGWIKNDTGAAIDEVLVSVMRKPHSYTREDVVEISCHGGPVLVHEILSLVLRNGARQALPGEFTFRAFMRGRIDITQAEAVQSLVDAPTVKAVQAGMRQLEGVVTEKTRGLLEDIRGMRTQSEALVSFPDEDIDDQTGSLLDGLKCLRKRFEAMLSHQKEALYLREGIRCVICGRPNVGKSSLFNSFMSEERVIVSHVAGTTRDVVEEKIYLDGTMVRLFDTAGVLRTSDRLHKKAVFRSELMIDKADTILFVLDASADLSAYEKNLLASFAKERRRVLIVLNKIDLRRRILRQSLRPYGFPVVEISVTRQQGIDALRKALVRITRSLVSLKETDTSSLNRRHFDALSQARDICMKAEQAVRQGRIDIVSTLFQEAEDQIESIIGRHLSEDILEDIFSNFCIGK